MQHRLRRERAGLPTVGDKAWVPGHTLKFRRGPIFEANRDDALTDEQGPYVPVERKGFWILIAPRVRVRERAEHLPARPLALIVRRYVDRQRLLPSGPEGLGSAVPSRERVIAPLGVVIRTLERWESGEIETVRASKADEIMVALGLHWWDVWDPDEYPEVAECLAA
jgi:hypothetical protein